MRQDLINKLADPSLVLRYESLDHIHGSKSEQTNGEIDLRLNASEAMELTQMTNNANANGNANGNGTIQKLSSSPSPVVSYEYEYPSCWNYLTLRHEQNSSWAQAQFDKGVSYAKAALHLDLSAENSNIHVNSNSNSNSNGHVLMRKAEVCYKEGLEMIPQHVQILTAFGALCINDGRLEMARDLLEKAIRCGQEEEEQAVNDDSSFGMSHTRTCTGTDGTLEDAKTYLSVVESKLHAREKMELASKKGQRLALSNKAEQAMNDALAERAFTEGEDPKLLSGSTKTNDKYQLLSSSADDDEAEDDEAEDDESSSEERRRKRRSNRKRKRRKRESKHRRRRDRSESRRRRKRRESERYDSSSESDDDDSDSIPSETSDEERKRRKHRKRRTKRKRRSRSKLEIQVSETGAS